MSSTKLRFTLSWIIGLTIFGILNYFFEELASSLGFKTSFYFEGFEYDQYVETDKSTSLGWFLILVEITLNKSKKGRATIKKIHKISNV